MRTLHADLTAAQKAATRIPYIELAFTSNDGAPGAGQSSYTYTTADSPGRIKAIQHREEPYNDYAVILLADPSNNLPDLVGYQLIISYGYNTATGNRTSAAPVLWVQQTRKSSKPGSTDVILYCEGTMSYLNRTELVMTS